ncbi:MAG: transglutaminase-like cysteine peptidase [Alphaproteobacteria bacterium]
MRTGALLIAGCLALGWAGPAVAAKAKLVPSFLNSREARNTNLKPFPKWTGMLQRFFEARGEVPGSCESTTFNKCHWQKWQALVEELRDKPLADQLAAVNRRMNVARYIVDPINWGVKDYWATPGEFFAKDGDCEDYAIAKYLTLQRLGVDPAAMRIVVLQDLNLRAAHAVLSVHVGDDVLILDNQIKTVINADKIRHYRPIFSINEQAWWLHKANK